jgi:hypothetical protein
MILMVPTGHGPQQRGCRSMRTSSNIGDVS